MNLEVCGSGEWGSTPPALCSLPAFWQFCVHCVLERFVCVAARLLSLVQRVLALACEVLSCLTRFVSSSVVHSQHGEIPTPSPRSLEVDPSTALYMATGTADNLQSDSRLYSFSPETKEKLRKFRLSTSRAKDPQAIICMRPPQPAYSYQRDKEIVQLSCSNMAMTVRLEYLYRLADPLTWQISST